VAAISGRRVNEQVEDPLEKFQVSSGQFQEDGRQKKRSRFFKGRDLCPKGPRE
jgi:hypothetical protein